MALYTILFGFSIFLIIMILTVIRKMFFDWKEEEKIERMMQIRCAERPAVSLVIYNDKCVVRRRKYADDIAIYDVLTKSDTSLKKDDDSSNKDDEVNHSDAENVKREIINGNTETKGQGLPNREIEVTPTRTPDQ